MTTFWIGAGGALGTPTSVVRRATLGSDGSLTLTAGTELGPDPMYLTAWGDRIVALHETNPAATSVWRVDGEGLAPIGTAALNGSFGACHLSVTNDDWVLTANYSGASISAQRLTQAGVSAGTSLALTGSGPRAGRQEGSHPHQVYLDTDRDQVLVNDLGTDAVRRFRFADGEFIPLGQIQLAGGTGPRHLVRHGSVAYVVGELDGSLTRVDLDANAVIDSVPTSATDHPRQEMACAAIRSTPSLVLVSNRGPNTIAVFDITGRTPELVSEASTGGVHPRDFHLSDDGRFVVVANQASDNLAVLAFEPDTGTLTATGISASTPSPVCVFPDRDRTAP